MLDGDLTYDEFVAMVDAWETDYNVNKEDGQMNEHNGNSKWIE